MGSKSTFWMVIFHYKPMKFWTWGPNRCSTIFLAIFSTLRHHYLLTGVHGATKGLVAAGWSEHHPLLWYIQIVQIVLPFAQQKRYIQYIPSQSISDLPTVSFLLLGEVLGIFLRRQHQVEFHGTSKTKKNSTVFPLNCVGSDSAFATGRCGQAFSNELSSNLNLSTFI